jgi:hypothetical protein
MAGGAGRVGSPDRPATISFEMVLPDAVDIALRVSFSSGTNESSSAYLDAEGS